MQIIFNLFYRKKPNYRYNLIQHTHMGKALTTCMLIFTLGLIVCRFNQQYCPTPCWLRGYNGVTFSSLLKTYMPTYLTSTWWVKLPQVVNQISSRFLHIKISLFPTIWDTSKVTASYYLLWRWWHLSMHLCVPVNIYFLSFINCTLLKWL